MSHVPYYTAIVTLLAVAPHSFLPTRVALGRSRLKAEIPATTGHPDCERVFRAHINTLEWMPTFPVPPWPWAIYFNDAAAAALGPVWAGGRILPRRLSQGRGEAVAGSFRAIARVRVAIRRCDRGRRHAIADALSGNQSGRLFN